MAATAKLHGGTIFPGGGSGVWAPNSRWGPAKQEGNCAIMSKAACCQVGQQAGGSAKGDVHSLKVHASHW